MSIFRLFIVLAFASAALGRAAESGVIVSLANVGDRVRAQNPDLAAARLSIREALGRMKQSGRPANPEIQAGFAHDSRVRERTFEIGFTQRFPLTARLRLEKAVTHGDYLASEAEVREVERQLVGAALAEVVKILSLRARRELLVEQERLASELAGLLAGLAERGEGSRLDAGQAELEAAGLALELHQLDAAEAGLLGAVKPLLGMLPDESLIVSGRLPPPRRSEAGPDPSARPDFQSAVLRAENASRRVELERARKFEDVEAGLFAASERIEDVPEGYDEDFFVGLRFRIPLPLWNKNEGAIEEAEARQRREELEAVALERSIRLEAAAARAEMERWAALLEELEQRLVPLSVKQTTAAEDALRRGEGDLQTVFRSRDKRLQLSAARIDALRQFHLARIRHAVALGQP